VPPAFCEEICDLRHADMACVYLKKKGGEIDDRIVSRIRLGVDGNMKDIGHTQYFRNGSFNPCFGSSALAVGYLRL
jgi:hypothetical protein